MAFQLASYHIKLTCTGKECMSYFEIIQLANYNELETEPCNFGKSSAKISPLISIIHAWLDVATTNQLAMVKNQLDCCIAYYEDEFQSAKVSHFEAVEHSMQLYIHQLTHVQLACQLLCNYKLLCTLDCMLNLYIVKEFDGCIYQLQLHRQLELVANCTGPVKFLRCLQSQSLEETELITAR